jgi:hypothetical protein
MMKRASITIKSELLQIVDERAHAEQMNRSQYITQALEAYTSGLMTADITPSYGQDATRVVLLEHDITHKDELLKERERLIDLYQAILGGRAVPLEPVKVGFWRRHFGRKKKDETI